MESAMRSNRLVNRLLTLAVIASGVGCAALSNPTTYPSVPVRRVPEEVLGKSRDAQIDIPQALLRQPSNQVHIIEPGDTLGIFLAEVKTGGTGIPPVNFPVPTSLSQTIGIGIPVQVLDDGTITIPYIDPVEVRDLTISQAQKKVTDELIKSGKYNADQFKFQLSLYRPRQYHVLVVRQDSGSLAIGLGGQLSSRRGNGYVLDLPAYKNDLLTALTQSGGLPGTDAKNEVIIQRAKLEIKDANTMPPAGLIPGIETIRVPLRLRPGEPIPFTQKDVILEDGDIVFVQTREAEVFYFAGLIQTREVPIPRDYDLSVSRAIMQNIGPVLNGGVFVNNQNGAIVGQGLGAPSPSQVTVLRRCPGKRQIAIRVDLNRALQDPREDIFVQPGDILILQETMGEAITRYTTGVIHNAFAGLISSGRRTADTITISSP
jgi:protein involved in polysaccharide export with SLBB domain